MKIFEEKCFLTVLSKLFEGIKWAYYPHYAQ
jgi:hypothetical protein